MSNTFSSKNLHPITKTLLKKRGIVGEKEIEDFLFPSYEKHIGDPFGIFGMRKAVERIIVAMKNREKIAVYSDYDCDGIPGGVLLRTFFDDIGYPVETYIPHRHNEGYGVHIHAIDLLKAKGVTLIITIDLAITNIEEIAYAKTVGVDFIVTDHHLPITEETTDGRYQISDVREQTTDELTTPNPKPLTIQIVPDAVAVLNSKQDVCAYGDDMLCGCAVAWKLACAVLAKLREAKTAQAVRSQELGVRSLDTWNTVLEKVALLPVGFEKWMLDLVGISTIADMVPLQKENRALAHFGLKVLRKTKRPGLLHIFNEQRMKLENIVEDDIAFTIAPRINAAGRMGDPMQAHMMLYEKDAERAEKYAYDLEELNTQRKGEVKDIVSTLQFDHSVYKNNVIVVGDLTWGPGILGLIAQRIIDETGKPVFVWGQGGEVETSDNRRQTTDGCKKIKDKKDITLKGSCRSKGDVHVVDLMARAGHDALTHWGGHEQAGGFSVSLDKIAGLSEALNEAFKHIQIKDIGTQEIVADLTLSIDDVNEVTYKAVEILAPFGVGNRKPIFELKNLTPLSTKWFGKKNEHFEVVYPTSRGGKIKAIQFFSSKDIEEKTSKAHTLLAHLEKSYFGGKTELRLRIVGIL